jgi:hypothetical protein
MLVQVPMDAKLAESLQQVADERGASVEDVMNDLARQYLRQARHEKISAEFVHYQAMHVELKAKYLDQHVAIHNGQVVDVDPDVTLLLRRVRSRFGDTPVLITQIEDEPIREYVIRSPRLMTE